jgi:phage shock protein A
MSNTIRIMGLLARIRDTLRSRVNALIDSATDPLSQIENLLRELREHMKSATAELISYKATEKRLAQRHAELAASAADWRKRAEAAVLAGDDELAKKALLEERRVAADSAACDRERAEMASYAAELLRARRELDQRIKELDIKKGTLAQGLAAARSSGPGVLVAEGKPWDALARAEAQIDDQAALAEVDAMLGDPLAEGDALVEQKLREKMKEAQADDALAEMKKRMGK